MDHFSGETRRQKKEDWLRVFSKIYEWEGNRYWLEGDKVTKIVIHVIRKWRWNTYGWVKMNMILYILHIL